MKEHCDTVIQSIEDCIALSHLSIIERKVNVGEVVHIIDCIPEGRAVVLLLLRLRAEQLQRFHLGEVANQSSEELYGETIDAVQCKVLHSREALSQPVNLSLGHLLSNKETALFQW